MAAAAPKVLMADRVTIQYGHILYQVYEIRASVKLLPASLLDLLCSTVFQQSDFVATARQS